MRQEFTRIWAKLNLNDPNVLADPLAAVLHEIADKYGAAASAFAADYYDTAREQSVPLAKRFEPVIAKPPPAKRFESLARWGVGPLFGADPNPALAENNLAGGLQFTVASAYRDTITASAVADPAAQGWQRVADGGACAFCLMLESRGSVYSEASADFASHDHCGCTAEPVFSGEPNPVRPYTPSARRISDADRARVRAWIKANPNG